MNPQAVNSTSEWEETPALSASLPIQFSDGAVLPEIRISCEGCGKPLATRLQRGRVVNLLPDVYRLTGLAACFHCEGLTRFDYRVRSEGARMSMEHRKDGAWRSICISRPSVWGRVFGLLRR